MKTKQPTAIYKDKEYPVFAVKWLDNGEIKVLLGNQISSQTVDISKVTLIGGIIG